MSGGWRFPFDRQTSTSALYQPQGIDPEFLKRVAALEQQAPKGLIDAALTAQPLQGLLDTGGMPGNDRGEGSPSPMGGESFGMSPGGNVARNDSAGGINLGYDPKAGGLGMMKGGILGLLGGVTAQQTAPVQSIVAPGLNGYNQGNYGASATEVGAPTEAQAKALADQLAAELAAYQSGGLLGGAQGSAGGSFGGYGGFGAGDYGDGTDR